MTNMETQLISVNKREENNIWPVLVAHNPVFFVRIVDKEVSDKEIE